jgi:hypothetical protein
MERMSRATWGTPAEYDAIRWRRRAAA